MFPGSARHRALALSSLVLALAACESAPPPGAVPVTAGGELPGQPVKAAGGPVKLEPRAEAVQQAATVGRGKEVCPLFLYPWDPAKPECQIGVTHCERDGAGMRCMSLADTRHVSCGKSEAICGEEVACACPAGAAKPVDEAPGTITLHPRGKGKTWRAPGCRAVEVDALPNIGAPPFPACLVLVHDCDEGQNCPERSQTLSCGVRSEICGKPVSCPCPK